MKFLALSTGWTGLLLAGCALAVVLLYLLRPSPRRLVVTSNLIWQRVLRERKRETEKWRWWISLLIALLIALAMALALARPEVAAVGGRAEDHVVVIDNSPSMATRTLRGDTRLQRALDRAADIVRAGGAGSRFLIVDTMRQRPVTGFVARDAALQQLRAIEPRSGPAPRFPDTVGPFPQSDGAKGASPSAVPATNPRRIWFVTDGIARLTPPAETRVLSVFESAPNVGITAFDVRAVPTDARRHEAFVVINNAGPTAADVEVLVGGAEGAPLKRSMRVQANAAASLLLDVSAFNGGVLRASVQSQADAFDLDNTAYAFLPGKSRVRLAVMTPGNAELMRALRLLPHLEIEVLSPAAAGGLARFDAAIFDRVAPLEVPPVPALLIAPTRRPWLPARTRDIKDSRIESWEAGHPLLAGVDLRDVLVDQAAIPSVGELGASRPPRRPDGVVSSALDPWSGSKAEDASAAQPGRSGSLPAGGLTSGSAWTVIARGPSDEALMLTTAERSRLAMLSFALGASNFSLQPGFPGFLANAVEWLTQEPQARTHDLGVVSLPLPGARVLDLNGNAVQTREAPESTLFDASGPGVFTAVTGDQRLRVVVNALNPDLSAINGVAAPANASELRNAVDTAVPVQSRARWTLDPWVVLLILAIGLLAFEWWAYHRRLTV